MLDKGTKSIDIIAPAIVSRMNEKLSWHKHATQDINYFNEDILIRYKKLDQ